VLTLKLGLGQGEIVMSEARLSIGEVANRAGVNVSAIRFYERQGLLPQPERVGGQRRYTDAVVRRLGIIDAAKQAGFSLDEVGVLLTSTDRGAPAHEQLRVLAADKLPEVDALIERAQTMRDWLFAASKCDCDTLDACALFGEPGAPEAIGPSARGLPARLSAAEATEPAGRCRRPESGPSRPPSE
jgi:MerR family transcriptional regulator, redox-sensitive transcriptional activator SoxR